MVDLSLSDFYRRQGYQERLIMLPQDSGFFSILHGQLPIGINKTGRAIVRAESGLLEVVPDSVVDEYLGSGEWDEVMGEDSP